jgi:plastocyanin
MKHLIALIALFSLASASVDSVLTTDEACCEEAPKSSYLALKTPVFAETVEKATVTGTVVFDGEKLPEVKPLEIAEAQAKDCTTGEPVDATNRTLVIDEKTKGIYNCVVSVVVKDAEVKIPEEPIVLDQAQCRYEPHVILIPAGATVEYLNSDTISHNVHTYAVKNQAFNKIIPAGAKGSQKLEKPEAVQAKCDIHPWMTCYLFVTEHPFTAKTDTEGNFSIEGLAPGKYSIEIWHESLGKAKASVTIAEDGTSEAVSVKITEKKKKSGRGRRR